MGVAELSENEARGYRDQLKAVQAKFKRLMNELDARKSESQHADNRHDDIKK